jgi:ribonuclease HI
LTRVSNALYAALVPFHDAVALKVYTDGSCFNNPGGRGGAAAIVEYPDVVDLPPHMVFQRGYTGTTNNRMELRACIEALRFIAHRGPELGVPRAVLLTDSQYVVDNAPRAPYWPAGQAVNHEGMPIRNRDLWREFLRVRAQIRFRLTIKWVPGKTTRILRDVDKLAKDAARTAIEPDRGYRPGAIGRRFTPGRRAAKAFPARGQSATFRIYKVEYLKGGGVPQHRVTFDLYSTSEADYIAPYFAFISARHVIHRGHCYEATFNQSRTYPMIETIKEVACPERRALTPSLPA